MNDTSRMPGGKRSRVRAMATDVVCATAPATAKSPAALLMHAGGITLPRAAPDKERLVFVYQRRPRQTAPQYGIRPALRDGHQNQDGAPRSTCQMLAKQDPSFSHPERSSSSHRGRQGGVHGPSTPPVVNPLRHRADACHRIILGARGHQRHRPCRDSSWLLSWDPSTARTGSCSARRPLPHLGHGPQLLGR